MSERVVDFINESSEKGGEKGVAKSIDGLTGEQDRPCIAGLVGFTDDDALMRCKNSFTFKLTVGLLVD